MRGSCTGMDYDYVLGVVAGSKACIAGFLKTQCRIGRRKPPCARNGLDPSIRFYITLTCDRHLTTANTRQHSVARVPNTHGESSTVYRFVVAYGTEPSDTLSNPILVTSSISCLISFISALQ